MDTGAFAQMDTWHAHTTPKTLGISGVNVSSWVLLTGSVLQILTIVLITASMHRVGSSLRLLSRQCFAQ
jgi:hypothetical protein